MSNNILGNFTLSEINKTIPNNDQTQARIAELREE